MSGLLARAATNALRASVAALSVLGVGGACCATGCVSYGQHLSATPLPIGERELSLNADVLVLDRGLGPQVLPNPEIGYRVGAARQLDFGARVNAGGIELNGRWRLLDAPFVDLALVPAVGLGFVPVTNQDTGLFNAHLLGALLASVPLSRRTILVPGVRGGATYAFPLTAFRGDADPESTYWFHLVGFTLGVELALSKSTRLMPDLNVLFPYHSGRDEWLFPTIQSGVALKFQ